MSDHESSPLLSSLGAEDDKEYINETSESEDSDEEGHEGISNKRKVLIKALERIASYKEQICELISLIDEKIELNNQMMALNESILKGRKKNRKKKWIEKMEYYKFDEKRDCVPDIHNLMISLKKMKKRPKSKDLLTTILIEDSGDDENENNEDDEEIEDDEGYERNFDLSAEEMGVIREKQETHSLSLEKHVMRSFIKPTWKVDANSNF